jgi:Dolichyl-phosphate-mannose-protein mannosyltransferase
MVNSTTTRALGQRIKDTRRAEEAVLHRFTLLVASILILVLVITFAYLPILRTGFTVVDDYAWLNSTMPQPLGPFLIRVFDPAQNNAAAYRPMFQGFFFLVHRLFGLDASGFHSVSLLLHIANAVLLYGITKSITHQQMTGLLGALLFAVYPIYGNSVFWIADYDELLAAFFYLFALWLWIGQLNKPNRLWYAATILCAACALLSKQSAITLLPLMGITDLFIPSARPKNALLLIRRYLLITIPFAAFAALELNRIQSTPVLNVGGEPAYVLGPHVWTNLWHYTAATLWPWTDYTIGSPESNALVVLVVMGVLTVWLTRRGHRQLLIPLAWLPLSILPVTPFTFDWSLGTRYLYLPAAALAMWIALAIAGLAERPGPVPKRILAVLCLVAIASLCLGIKTVQAQAAGFQIFTRSGNLLVRQIRDLHPKLKPNTQVYLINMPFGSRYLGDALRVRYGVPLAVTGDDEGHVFDLGGAPDLVILYYEDKKIWDFPTDIAAMSRVASSAELPINFQDNLRLIGFAVPNPSVNPGTELLFLSYWKVMGPVSKAYTLFNHLVGSDGRTVGQFDGLLQYANADTRQWHAGQPVAIPMRIPVEMDAAPGTGYRLEVGLYDSDSVQRLARIDRAGRTLNSFDLGPIEVR